MGRIELGDAGRFGKSPNTLVDFTRDVSQEDVTETIASLAAAQPILSGSKICLLFGMGAQPRSLFQSLERESGLALLFYRSPLNGVLAILRPMIPSYEGAIRVNDPRKLPLAFSQLMDSSMVGLYCVDVSHVDRVEQAMRLGGQGLDFRIKEDPGYLLYVVDADNADAATGIHEIVSYGTEAPDALIPQRLR
jgi:hypothetical protein